MAFSPVAGAVVHDNAGNVVLVQERKHYCRGRWNLPMGKVEPGERILEGALREIREETGLEVRITGFLRCYEKRKEDAQIIKFTFLAEAEHGPLRHDPDELLDAQWFPLEEAIAHKALRTYEVRDALLAFKHGHRLEVDAVLRAGAHERPDGSQQ